MLTCDSGQLLMLTCGGSQVVHVAEHGAEFWFWSRGAAVFLVAFVAEFESIRAEVKCNWIAIKANCNQSGWTRPVTRRKRSESRTGHFRLRIAPVCESDARIVRDPSQLRPVRVESNAVNPPPVRWSVLGKQLAKRKPLSPLVALNL